MIFSLRQIQKYREQRRRLHIALVDLTEVFDVVSSEGLYDVLHKNTWPLISLVAILHDDMEAHISSEGASSSSFELKRGVKQCGSVLGP